jgi:exodeoxyribonuclease VII small subunit
VASTKDTGKGQYGAVVGRLQEIVQALEAGELSLEDSLERFAEGVALVKQGEQLLTDAEKRVEQLLSEDGRVAPLKVPENAPEPAAPPLAKTVRRQVPSVAAPPPPGEHDDDVPF